MLNKISNLLKKITKKIDKYIVMPTTRLVFKITNSFDKSSHKLENILSKEFKVDSFVKISSNGITVVVDADKDSYEDANKIIRRIQEEYEDEKYITVKFN